MGLVGGGGGGNGAYKKEVETTKTKQSRPRQGNSGWVNVSYQIIMLPVVEKHVVLDAGYAHMIVRVGDRVRL
jgi:hypothetical protein